MKFTFKSTLIAAAIGSMISTSIALAGDLVINFDDPNPGPKAGFEAAVEAFKKANPDINVTVNINDREAHKTAIRNFLSADAPDITSWYPGNRMAPFVEAGLFEDVSDVWEANGFSDTLAAIKPTMTIGRQAVGCSVHLLSMGCLLPQGYFRQARIGRAEELGRVSTLLR